MIENSPDLRILKDDGACAMDAISNFTQIQGQHWQLLSQKKTKIPANKSSNGDDVQVAAK